MLPSLTLCSVVVRGVPGQGITPVSSQCQHPCPMKTERTMPVVVPEAVPEIDIFSDFLVLRVSTTLSTRFPFEFLVVFCTIAIIFMNICCFIDFLVLRLNTTLSKLNPDCMSAQLHVT